MGAGFMEPLILSNGKLSIPDVPDGTGSHQSDPAPSSSPVNAESSEDRETHCPHGEKRDTNGCRTPNESPRHISQTAPSCGDVPCGYNDFDPTKSLPQINTILQVTNNHVSRTRSIHDKVVSPASIEPKSSASSGPSVATQRQPVSADLHRVEDGPIYNIGEMKIFDQKQKAIPKLYEARWQVIRPEIFDRVETRLRRGRFAVRLNKPRAPTIIELMSAGVDKERSMPAVVVVIPKHVKAMQNFLDTNSTVQSRCRPEDGTTVELLVLACKGSSTLIGMPGELLRIDEEDSSGSDDSGEYSDDDSSLNSRGDSDSSGAVHPTLSMLEVDTRTMSVVCEGRNDYGNGKYGMGIRLITKDGSRFVRGTCGGILQLNHHNQPPKQVGLIAGHLLEQLGQGPEEINQETVEIPCRIGEIFHPKISTKIPQHDWALFDAGKLSLSYDMAAQTNLTIAQNAEIPNVSTLVVIRTTRGEMTGTLSSSTSGIMLRPNQGFVHVRTIIMDRRSVITKGDSGAWVYHQEFGKVYGYVIAANGIGHTYMVPMHAAITEMRLALGAVSISLAFPMDGSFQLRLSKTNWHSQRTQSAQISSESDSETNMSATRNVIQGLKELAETLLDDGKAAVAILWLETGVSIQERLPQEDQGRLAWQHRLGKAYVEAGLASQGIEILKKIVKIREEVLEDNHTDTLAAQHELAVAYIQNGQASEAITLLKNVVATEAAILDEHDIGRLTSQHELARAYLADGQASEALSILQHVVAVKGEILEKSDSHLLASQIVLAEANLRAGRTLDAVEILETVFDAATGTSSEHRKIRTQSREWLKLARRQLSGTDPQRLLGQVSKPLSIFLKPRR